MKFWSTIRRSKSSYWTFTKIYKTSYLQRRNTQRFTIFWKIIKSQTLNAKVKKLKKSLKITIKFSKYCKSLFKTLLLNSQPQSLWFKTMGKLRLIRTENSYSYLLTENLKRQCREETLIHLILDRVLSLKMDLSLMKAESRTNLRMICPLYMKTRSRVSKENVKFLKAGLKS